MFLEIISLDAWIVALVDFGHLGKFWFMICIFNVCWSLQSIGITEKEQVDLARDISRKVKVARYNDDNDDDDDDDDRNIYLRNEYL